jgi:hypothetical protein
VLQDFSFVIPGHLRMNAAFSSTVFGCFWMGKPGENMGKTWENMVKSPRNGGLYIFI